MIKLFLIALLALGAPAAAVGQGPAPSEGTWSRSGDRVTLTQAQISLPERAGVTALRQSLEFSRQGEGLDNALQYASPDSAVFATVYIYYPGLPHVGIAAFMTDRIIAAQGSPEFRGLGPRIVSAGAREGVAIRYDYDGFRQDMASSAAFIKAGRWIIKLRVSGPQARQQDVRRAMTELLAGVRFGGPVQPREAAPLTIGQCSGNAPADARQRPDPRGEELAGHAFIGTLDGGGLEGSDENGTLRSLPSRLPNEFCVSTEVDTGGVAPVAVLRAADGPPLSIDGRTVLLVPLTDNGNVLEVAHVPNLGGYIMLFHQIGSTSLLAQYEAVPSDRQIRELITTPSHPAGQARAVIQNLPNGDSRINLVQQPQTPET